MDSRGKQTLGEDGVWRDGAAGPELLPAHMRKLPGDLVTKHISEADKVHEADETHIVKAIEYDRTKSELAEERETHGARLAQLRREMARVPVGTRRRLSQKRIDIEIFHAIRSILKTYDKRMARGEDVDLSQVYHLWFHTDNVNDYELRSGNPPALIDRPKLLQAFNLVVDPLSPPQRVVDSFARAGIELSDNRAVEAGDAH